MSVLELCCLAVSTSFLLLIGHRERKWLESRSLYCNGLSRSPHDGKMGHIHQFIKTSCDAVRVKRPELSPTVDDQLCCVQFVEMLPFDQVDKISRIYRWSTVTCVSVLALIVESGKYWCFVWKFHTGLTCTLWSPIGIARVVSNFDWLPLVDCLCRMMFLCLTLS